MWSPLFSLQFYIYTDINVMLIRQLNSKRLLPLLTSLGPCVYNGRLFCMFTAV